MWLGHSPGLVSVKRNDSGMTGVDLIVSNDVSLKISYSFLDHDDVIVFGCMCSMPFMFMICWLTEGKCTT